MSNLNATPPGYLTGLKTMLVEALKIVFDEEFPEEDFRNIRVSKEYPVQKHYFPSIWVSYDDVQDLQTAGIDHYELTEPDENGNRRKFKRWRFGGYASFTVVALTSFERDRLTDLLISVIAFGSENPATAQFRDYVENNEFIGAVFDWDRIKVTASGETPGTPWGSDEIMYERTIAMSLVGEFISDGTSGAIVPLSAIIITPIEPDEDDPTDPSKGEWV